MKKNLSDRGVLLIIDSKDKRNVVSLFNILWERHKIASRIEEMKSFKLFGDDIEFWAGDFKKEAKQVIIVTVNNSPYREQMIKGFTNRNLLNLNLRSKKDIDFAIIKVRLVFLMLNKILNERRWTI